jgi:hypothetical protein
MFQLMKIFLMSIFPLLFSGIIKEGEFNCGDIKKNWVQDDGPYILYKNGKVVVKYVYRNKDRRLMHEDSVAEQDKENLELTVATDEPGITFKVRLKKEIVNEIAEYPEPDKLLAISDIEGNFSAFRKLLQAGGVIDKDFNWTFGEGRLVLIGDFVDRGEQVTEVLWLIYALEEMAKAAGGYVHFILGNHEVMNLSGDLRYVHHKYRKNQSLLKEKFEMLYGKNSELGRWLLSKNIVEKIGNILFAHGGISADVNRLNATLSSINNMARPYYTDSSFDYPAPVNILFDETGPLWFRGYYAGKKRAGMQTVDSSLSIFNVRYITTGHSIVADTISLWFDGKVINIDLRHDKGFSEALLLEDNKFYRLNADGERKRLMNR